MIGLLIGLLVARLGIPSFVVTLAVFLGLQGVMLVLIGEGGTIAYRNEIILALNNDTMPSGSAGPSRSSVSRRTPLVDVRRTDRRRRRAGLESQPVLLWAIKTVGAGRRRPRWSSAYLSAWSAARNPALKSIKGVPHRRRHPGRAAGRAHLPAQPHRLGPPRLRRRRQRRGRPPGRHQRLPGQAHLLHHVLDARGGRRHC